MDLGPVFSSWRIPTEEPRAPELERKLRLVSAGLAAVFASAGATKLIGGPVLVELFERVGLVSARLPIGVVELVIAGLLLSSRTRSWGAMATIVVMAGAALTHVFTGVLLPALFINAAIGLTATWVVVKQRPAFLSG